MVNGRNLIVAGPFSARSTSGWGYTSSGAKFFERFAKSPSPPVFITWMKKKREPDRTACSLRVGTGGPRGSSHKTRDFGPHREVRLLAPLAVDADGGFGAERHDVAAAPECLMVERADGIGDRLGVLTELVGRVGQPERVILQCGLRDE